MTDTLLSPHFSLLELTSSQTATRRGIDNTASPEIIQNLKLLCENILEPLRARLNEPIRITSGYRCDKLNKAIGGAKNSQHLDGKAVDFTVDSMGVEDLFIFICNTNLQWSQCIQEFDSWIHISFDETRKREKLRATKKNGKTVYTKV